MHEGFTNALSRARSLHRAGDLAPARAVYEALLGSCEAPPDGAGAADLLGLLGVLALQEGHRQEAEALLRRALACEGAAPADTLLRLRNLNNLLVLLQQTGRRDAAGALLAGGVPDWPPGATPDPAERGTVLSLGRALLLLGDAAAALRLIEAAIPDPAGDAEAMALTGRLQLEFGQPAAALVLLETAAALLPGDAELAIALGHARQALGDEDGAAAMAGQIATRWPVCAMPQRPSQRVGVLVLNPVPLGVGTPGGGLESLHFAGNFAAQLVRDMQDEFRFHSAFGELPPEALPAAPPAAQVMLNNCVNGEAMNVPGRLDQALAALDWAGLPVINHPTAVAATTRQKTADLLRGIPGLRVPGIARYPVSEETAVSVLADIEQQFAYPVILRRCQAHKSADLQHSATEQVAILVEDGAAAREALKALRAPEIYAMEYVPLRKKAGYFRKVRALLAEDEVVCAVPGFYSEWLVAGARRQPHGMAFYRAHPETVAESTQIVLDPESVLGADCMRVLEAVRDRMPLDFFGIDFDVDDDGKVVFFEANAAMNLLRHPGEPEDIALPDAPFERIKAAFRRAVDRRIGGAG